MTVTPTSAGRRWPSRNGHGRVTTLLDIHRGIPKDDLKSLPLSEVEKQFGTSPDGLSLTRREATKLLAQHGPMRSRRRRPVLSASS